MLSGEGNKNGEKTIGLISKKATLHVQHTFFFFFTFICRCFARLEEMSYVFSFFFFFTASHSLLALVATSISHFVTPATKFSFVLPTKKCVSPFFSLSFAGLPPTFSFFSVFLLLYIPNLWT